MIIVSERLNGQFTDVEKAIKEKDAEVIQELAREHVHAGSDYLDVNVGTAVSSGEKKEAMLWMVETIQEVTDVPLAIDSPVEDVLKAGVRACKNPPMINSTQADPEQLNDYLQLAVEEDAAIIALTMDEDGVPNDVQKRVELAGNIVVAAMNAGLPFDHLYIDLVALPVRATQAQPGMVLEALQQLQGIADPSPHFMLGLSNVSQGAVKRSLINRTFLVMCMAMGLDSAILDPMDDELMDALITAELLMNKQIYSDSFLSAYRSSKRG